MPVFAMTTAGKVGIIIGAVVVVNLIVDGMVASYGRDKGYPFAPLFISAFFLGFPLVLLAIVIGAGPSLGRRADLARGSDASSRLDTRKQDAINRIRR